MAYMNIIKKYKHRDTRSIKKKLKICLCLTVFEKHTYKHLLVFPSVPCTDINQLRLPNSNFPNTYPNHKATLTVKCYHIIWKTTGSWELTLD